MQKISIFEIVGNLCINNEEGQKVFDLIKESIDKREKIILSFQNIDIMTTTFLNTAIGQLYGIFENSTIKNSVTAQDLSLSDKELIKTITSNAKLFYNNSDISD